MRAIASDTGAWTHMVWAAMFVVALVVTLAMIAVSLVALARHRAGKPGWLWESRHGRAGVLVQHGTDATWTIVRTPLAGRTGLVLVAGPVVVTLSRYATPFYRHQVRAIESLLGVSLPEWQRNVIAQAFEPVIYDPPYTVTDSPLYRSPGPVPRIWRDELTDHRWSGRPEPTPRPGQGRPRPIIGRPR